jgi:hypothetical protein
MNKRRWLGMILLVAGLALAAPALAQAPPSAPKAPAAKEQVFKVTLKGTISYMKNMGGYYLCCTPEEYAIENQNPKVLGALAKSGKQVSVEGRVSRSSGYLFIEKLDGKPYEGKGEPYSGK